MALRLIFSCQRERRFLAHLLGVHRLPTVQLQPPAQWDTAHWQRVQAEALQDWKSRWSALDLPDTLPPEWYEKCEDQLDRVTSCWLHLPEAQRFDIGDAWLIVLSNLETRYGMTGGHTSWAMASWADGRLGDHFIN